MGTTGGNREKLIYDVTKSKLYAVIAPNMAKQIVAMQMALEDLSQRYPKSFDGYTLSVTVSILLLLFYILHIFLSKLKHSFIYRKVIKKPKQMHQVQQKQ